jgi:hypothetical protein
LAPTYKLNSNGQILLESKDDMKKRGAASPDAADAVAVTFAYPVARRKGDEPRGNRRDVVRYYKEASANWMN